MRLNLETPDKYADKLIKAHVTATDALDAFNRYRNDQRTAVWGAPQEWCIRVADLLIARGADLDAIPVRNSIL